MYDDKIIENVKFLVRKEILRVKDFASIAENPFESDSLISEIQKKYYTFDIKEANENVYIGNFKYRTGAHERYDIPHTGFGEKKS